MWTWSTPHLHLVTDRTLSHLPFLQMIEESLRGGITTLQLREKNISTKEFIALGEQVKRLTKFYNVPLIINDRVDVAIAIDAEGVHLGQSDMPYPIAREILGPNKIIGLTVENDEQVIDAEKYLDINYLGVSSLFPTGTKDDIQTIFGLDGLKRVRSLTKHNLVAIGGVNLQNVQDVLLHGANEVAVVSAICSAANPEEKVQEFLTTMQKTLSFMGKES